MRCLLYAFCACLLPFLPAEPVPDDSPFDALHAAFLDSWNRHDAHAFAAIFTEDAVVTTVGGTRVLGRDALEKYMQPSFTGPAFKDSKYSATIKEARTIGPGVAVLDLDWEMTGARSRDGATRPLRKGTLNWVVVRRGDLWLITSYHNSEFSQPSASPVR